MPLSCDDITLRMDDLLDRRLDPIMTGRVEAHLLLCERCAWSWHERLEAAIRAGDVRVPEPSDLAPLGTPAPREGERGRRGPSPASLFYGSAFSRMALRAAAEPETRAEVFIVNLGENLPVSFSRRPLLNKAGEVAFSISFQARELLQSDALQLEVVYLPTGETLGPIRIDPSADVVFKGRLERNADLDSALHELEDRRIDLLPLPSSAFALRVWWDRADEPA